MIYGHEKHRKIQLYKNSVAKKLLKKDPKMLDQIVRNHSYRTMYNGFKSLSKRKELFKQISKIFNLMAVDVQTTSHAHEKFTFMFLCVRSFFTI